MSEFSWTTLADTCRRFVRAHDDPHVDDQILGTILRNLRDAAGAPAELQDRVDVLSTMLRRMARRSVEHRQDAASWEFDYWDLLDEIGGVSPE